MNPQAQATSTGQSRARSSRFARSASAVGALAVLAVNGLGCGTELGGPADDEEATASIDQAATNPWPTSWTSSNPATSTVKDDAGFTAIHYQSSSGTKTKALGTSATWTFQTPAPANADIIFTWDYSGNHGTAQASARLRAFADGPNGSHTEIFLVGTQDKMQPVSGAFGGNGFSNRFETALRVYEGYTYGFIVEGADSDVSPILQGDLNVQYRAEKIVKSVQFGGQLWPAGSGFSNVEAIAPPGAFITEVRVYWTNNVIAAMSWAYSDNSCVHTGPCLVAGPNGNSLNQFSSGNITFNSSERLGSCNIRDSGWGNRSLRELVLAKHPALDSAQTKSVTFGPNGFDNDRMTDTNGDYLVGFYGAYNNDNFFASIGLITRKPQ